MWAGIECTVNRVGDQYFDQIARTGHERRASDIDLLADLGVTRVRYPVLWERTAPTGAPPQWAWPDARLLRLRERGVAPIVGLLHHGSGPLHTSMLDPQFPTLLADYARAVASRYPWVDAYTPVNEPLTTARFSGLYGHWYPHGHDDQTFVACLMSESVGTVRAMQAIRQITPLAKLVMTEDLGFTQCSSRALQPQADFENERRWLSIDLVAGRVHRGHPMYWWLRGAGAPERDLDWLVGNACPPDIIGCNYYVTSERFIDDNLDAWPAHTHGGNGKQRYADVESVRACGLAGVGSLVRHAWDRYHLPLAITEVHLGCTREEQLRWLVEVEGAMRHARASGIDVRAVTAWAAFGSIDWHCLLTREEGCYEPGLFDVRGPEPRPTALAGAVRALALGRRVAHPVLEGPGWWNTASQRRPAIRVEAA